MTGRTYNWNWGHLVQYVDDIEVLIMKTLQAIMTLEFQLLSSHLYYKATFFLSCNRKFHMHWTSFKRPLFLFMVYPWFTWYKLKGPKRRKNNLYKNQQSNNICMMHHWDMYILQLMQLKVHILYGPCLGDLKFNQKNV